MTEHYFKAKTPHATIDYVCYTYFTQTKNLEVFMDKFKFDRLCEIGCPNYGNKWSCPPYAPDYIQYVKEYDYIDIFMLVIELKQLEYIKQNYLKVKAANSILKSRIDKALRNSMSENEFYISTGSCRLCKSCKKKRGEPCAYPERRTYSFEALGINVSLLTTTFFHKELLWYRTNYLPQYTAVVAGLLTNNKNKNIKVIDELLKLE